MVKFDCFSGSTVLVTGGTGFKGSWLCCWLTMLGADVHVLADAVPTRPSNFCEGGVQGVAKSWVVADIRDKNLLKQKVMELKPDFVFHLAAQPLVPLSYQDPLLAWTVNCNGTVNLLECLRDVDWQLIAVFITSDKVYKNVEWQWGYRENDLLGGVDPYSASKGAAELAINSYFYSFFSDNRFVRLAVGRAGNVIGGGDWSPGRIVPDIVRHAIAGVPLKLRNPSATRPWQHVLEPIRGYLRLAEKLLKESDSVNGQPFNFGPPADALQTVEQVVQEFNRYWSGSRVDWVPEKGKFYEAGLLKLNCDKALSALDWKPCWNFEDTMQKTVQWYSFFYDRIKSGESSEMVRDYTIRQIREYENVAS